MNCSYHEDRKAVSVCKICGANLCDACESFQQQNGFCARCQSNLTGRNYQTFKKSFKYNILSLICAILFISIWLISLITNTLSVGVLIIGGIVAFTLLVISIFMLILSIKNMKKIRNYAQKNASKSEK